MELSQEKQIHNRDGPKWKSPKKKKGDLISTRPELGPKGETPSLRKSLDPNEPEGSSKIKALSNKRKEKKIKDAGQEATDNRSEAQKERHENASKNRQRSRAKSKPALTQP